MPRWAMLSLLTLSALAAALGLRLGWMTATLDESAVIDRYAGRYVAAGGDRADCHAEPGAALFERVVVICAPPGRPGARHLWAVAPWGQLLRADTPGARDAHDREASG
jgi:hypothetical protein